MAANFPYIAESLAVNLPLRQDDCLLARLIVSLTMFIAVPVSGFMGETVRIYQMSTVVTTAIQLAANSARTSQQQGFKIFTPDVGWVLAALLFLLLILRDAVRDFLKKAADAMITGIMKRFAGSRIFRTRAILIYRNTISLKLTNIPVPFKLPVKISMKNVYIPLRAATTSKPVTDATMDLGQAIAKRKRALVLGAPGSGKSLFLRYLAWSECSRTDGPESSIPVIVPLTRLAARDDSILSEITTAFNGNGFPRATEFISRDLARKVPRLLILFDGLDEVGSGSRLQVSNQIAQFGKTYPGARFIVTCRTAAYSGSLDGTVDEVFYVQDLSDELVDRFLYAWPALNARGAVDRLINALRDTPRVAILVRNPLLLTMLAYLYSYEYKESVNMLPRNRTQFYRDATELLLRRWQEEFNKFPWMAKKVVLQHLAMVNEQQGADRREITYENILREIRDVLPRVNIEPDQADEVLAEIHERSGILTSLDNGERYQFAHLTLQEYFAAGELIDKPDKIIDEYRRDQEAWREPLKLWCGGESDATAVIRSVTELDEVLALECLADATRVDESFAVELIDRMKPALEKAAPGDAVVRAFGLLASDRRPRGREVFSFLVRRAKESRAGPSYAFLVRQAKDSRPRPSYAAALAATNLKDAADVLAELAGYDGSLWPLLEQMGNLAVPGLSRRARAGDRESLASLTAIGTPRAAEALVAALSNPSLDVARAAAIGLIQLSASRTIEDALAQLTVPQGFAIPAALDWASQPFTTNRPESERHTLQLIYGRVIELLESVSHEDLTNVSRPLDARLAIFVFSFSVTGEPRKVDLDALSTATLESQFAWTENLDYPSRRRQISTARMRENNRLAAVIDILGTGAPELRMRARDDVLAAMEEQMGAGPCQLLRLTELLPVAALLASILGAHSWQPARREWLAIGDKQIFIADGSTYYHQLPVGLTCAASVLSAAYMMYAGLHAQGWLGYLDLAAAAACILGLIYIAVKPWNEIADHLAVWDDVESAVGTTLLSPLGGLIEIVDALDFNEYAGGLTVFLFTPAWLYSLFIFLVGNFDIAVAIPVELTFIAAVTALFVVGQAKEAHSRTPFRQVFTEVEMTSTEAAIS
jgi:hypothetical protein